MNKVSITALSLFFNPWINLKNIFSQLYIDPLVLYLFRIFVELSVKPAYPILV